MNARRNEENSLRKARNILSIAIVACLALACALPIWAGTNQPAGNQAGAAPAAPAAQNAAAPPPTTGAIVPQLIKFSGTLLDADGHPSPGPVGVTFALYAEETGGSALWMETQNVTPNSDGTYTVLLGAESAEGIPTQLFASGQAHWLGIQVEQKPELPRVLLVSVPYAMKAADAQTLGGQPASAYVLASPPANSSSAAAGGITGLGTEGFLARFTGAQTIADSVLFQSGNSIGLGTTTPAFKLDVNGSANFTGTVNLTSLQSATDLDAKAAGSINLKSGKSLDILLGTDFGVTASNGMNFTSGNNLTIKSGAAFTTTALDNMSLQAGTALNLVSGTSLKINSGADFTTTATGGMTLTSGKSLTLNSGAAFTTTTSGSISLQAGTALKLASGTTLQLNGLTGVSINGNVSIPGTLTMGGLITFAPGQTFPITGTGGGTITGVSAGTGLTGGGTTGTVTLSLNTAYTNSLYAQLSGNNAFTGNNSFTGNNTFVGNGAGLTALNPANLSAGTAAINITGSAATAVTAGTASNALMLGGMPPSAFVQTGSTSSPVTQNFSGAINLQGNMSLAALNGVNPTFTVTDADGSSFSVASTASFTAPLGSGGTISAADNAAGAGGSLNIQGNNAPANGPIGSSVNLTAGNGSGGAGGNINLIPGTGTTNGVVNVNGNLVVAGAVTCGSGCSGGSGTVTSVATGLGLLGGPITTSGTLTIDPAVVPQLGAASNTFSGSIAASSFTGNGANLSNVNALTLGGNLPSAFATTGANSFTGNQSITGNISLTGSLALPNTTSSTVGLITLGETTFLHNLGTGNTFVGAAAGNIGLDPAQATENTAVGYSALEANTTGPNNTAFGALALARTTVCCNSAFGQAALYLDTTGFSNVAFGSGALSNLTGGNSNIAIGYNAGNNLSSNESNNIYIGSLGVNGESDIIRIGTPGTHTATYLAGSVTIGTASNPANLVVNGTVSCTSGCSGGGGTITGVLTPSGSGLIGGATTGTVTLMVDPTVVAEQSGTNTFTGSNSFTSSSNSFTGNGAGLSNVNALTLNGNLASAFATTGANTFTGNQSITGNLTLSGNLALPPTNTAGTAGVITLGGTPFLHNYGSFNTFVGASAGNMTMTGSGQNTAVGAYALLKNTTGNNNSALGVDALHENSTGGNNSAFGLGALGDNVSGGFNSAFGSGALNLVIGTSDNSAFGSNALSLSQGSRNSAFGSDALGGLGMSGGVGDFNIAIGQNAGGNLTSGSNNIYIGSLGPTLPNTIETGMIRIGDPAFQSSNIYIGNAGVSGESGIIRIGSTQTATYLTGNVNIPGTLTMEGVINFAANQSFPITGTNGGTVTNVATALGLTGGPITSSGTLAIDTTVVPQLAMNNLFTGNNTFNSVTLPSTTSPTMGVIIFGTTPFLHNFGSQNTFVGELAGNTTMSQTLAIGNTAVGAFALTDSTTGGANSAFGAQTLVHNTTGGVNSAFGASALENNTTGNNNSAFGNDALTNLTGGSSNIAIGYNAGKLTTSESNNIYIGNAGAVGDSGVIRIGDPTVQTATYLAGNLNVTGTITCGSGCSGGSGGTITGVLTPSGSGLTGGGTMGTLSLAIDSSVVPTLGANNVFSGSNTFGSSSSSTQTVTGSLTAGSTLSGNTVSGNYVTGATVNATSNFNLNGNVFAYSLGADSVFLGFAGQSVSSTSPGQFNTAIGYQALNSNGKGGLGGSYDTAVGMEALYYNTAGVQNTAVGAGAMLDNTTGTVNTAAGASALGLNTTGSYNTATGESALFYNTTGNNNTAVGFQAGVTATAANGNATGSNNTFLGYSSGPGTSTPLNNATAIGANAVVNCPNCMVLGSINGLNNATSNVNVGIGTATPGATLDVEGTGNAPSNMTLNVGGNATITGNLNVTGSVTCGSGCSGGGSGGITAVNTPAGGGLMGGVTSGAANLSLITCSAGQVLEYNSGWGCNIVSSGAGVTEVIAGQGLTTGPSNPPILSSGTLAIDPTVVPQLNVADTFTTSLTVTPPAGSGLVPATLTAPSTSSGTTPGVAGLIVTGGSMSLNDMMNAGDGLHATGGSSTATVYGLAGNGIVATGGNTSAIEQNVPGIGVIGTGGTFGGTGGAGGPGGTGVQGTGGNSTGGYGGGTGVYGIGGNSASGVGGVGIVARGGSGPGGAGLAGDFGGDVFIFGGLTAASGSFNVSSSGLVTFVSGQTFPGTGTLTGVTAGTGLAGGGTTGTVILNNTGVLTVTPGTGLTATGTTSNPTLSNTGVLSLAAVSPIVVGPFSPGGAQTPVISLDTTQVPLLTNSNNAFTGTVTAAAIGIGGDTPITHNPRLVFSTFLVGNLGNNPLGGAFIPDAPIAITRVLLTTTSPGSVCTTASSVGLYEYGTRSLLFAIDLPNGEAYADSGLFSTPMTVPFDGFYVQGIAGTTCGLGSSASNVNVTVQYVMQ